MWETDRFEVLGLNMLLLDTTEAQGLIRENETSGND
jgi:hypothetical protein